MAYKPCVVCKNDKTTLWANSTDVEYLSTENSYNYLHCDSCQTIFIEKFPIDELSTIYPSNYYSFLSQKKNAALRIKEYLDKRLFKKTLKSFNNKPINILDIGGGSGWLMDIIKEVYPNVNITQVVDIDPKAQKLAEANGHNYFCGPIEDFNSDVKYDFVLMLNLIEHISGPKDTLIQIEELMNPQGKVLIKTPNVDSLDARIFKNTYWGGLHCPRHWVLFSEKSFKHMVAETKLNIASFKFTQGAPFWAWSILIKLKKLGLAKITKERPIMYHPLIPILHIVFAAFDITRGMLGAKPSQMFILLEKN